jgi:L-aminopeptidase/D-esterase-like protein
VAGVEVGHTTLVFGEGDLKVGAGPVRTGVTAVLPLGKTTAEGVSAGWFALNGVGEMTGAALIEEYGTLFGPVLLTNTLSVGTVRDAVIQWSLETVTDRLTLFTRSIPLVAETWDGELNDIYGFHVKREHAFDALNGARSGPVEEGSVGGGTGMTAYEFKAGIGSSSRVVETAAGTYTVGTLVQANHGSRYQLLVAGVPVGREIRAWMPSGPETAAMRSSIIILVGTDAPLLPAQLKRLAKRAALGLARTGSIAANSSGDVFLAFSTGNRARAGQTDLGTYRFVRNEMISPLFEATIQAVEESIINALVAAETMTGINGRTVYAIPHGELREVLSRYGRLKD